MITLYTYILLPIDYFKKAKYDLINGKVVSRTKNGYALSGHFLYSFMKSFETISYELSIATC